MPVSNYLYATTPPGIRRLPPLNRPLSAYIEDATRSGVKIYLCSTAMRDRGLEPTDMLEECQSVLGMVTMLERLAQVGTTVLTY